MNIGYACLALAVPGSEMKTCTLKNATPDRLLALIGHNLDALERVIDYNTRQGIRLFRISSELIPFGSSMAYGLPWRDVYAAKLSAIGEKIMQAGMRVSMHPGQYTVLNSPDAAVVERAVQDLAYHAAVLDSLGLGAAHKLILHLGGAYGDKKQAEKCFLKHYADLPQAVQNRLVLENDGALFTVADVLETAAIAGIPVVYDNLHNAVNRADAGLPDAAWVRQCAATWKVGDGSPKVHYSQQHADKKPGAHSDTIHVDAFLAFVERLEGRQPDIMLEVKDKNISALKCMNGAANRGMAVLEAEWARYKYTVLERSPETYNTIRQLLRNKGGYPALEMYRLIESALALPVERGNAVNAAQHVWGYFKDKATEAEKKRFQSLLAKFGCGEAKLQTMKNNLLRLAAEYQEEYLLNAYYFYVY